MNENRQSKSKNDRHCMNSCQCQSFVLGEQSLQNLYLTEMVNSLVSHLCNE